SSRNTINGITTTIVPPYSIHAGNINKILLPTPVSITVTTGLSSLEITLITLS
ncbi:hypothetical protein EJ08DRAFT_572146, partial [Tothia fuscella]